MTDDDPSGSSSEGSALRSSMLVDVCLPYMMCLYILPWSARHERCSASRREAHAAATGKPACQCPVEAPLWFAEPTESIANKLANLEVSRKKKCCKKDRIWKPGAERVVRQRSGSRDPRRPKAEGRRPGLRAPRGRESASIIIIIIIIIIVVVVVFLLIVVIIASI